VVELVGGEGIAEALQGVLVLATLGPADLLGEGPLLTKFDQQRVVHEEQDVLLEVVRLGLALELLRAGRVTGEYALQDAQFTGVHMQKRGGD
jgi:hypothetical protein